MKRSNARRAGAPKLQALCAVPADEDGGWVAARDIAGEANRRDLYRNDDGSPVGSKQVCQWTDDASFVFEREHDRVRPEASSPRWMLSRWSPVLGDERIREWHSRQDGETAILTFNELEELGVELPRTRDGISTSRTALAGGLGVDSHFQVVAGRRVARIDRFVGGFLFRHVGDDGTNGDREPRRHLPADPSDQYEPTSQTKTDPGPRTAT